MENTKSERMDTLKRIFSDEAFAEALMGTETVEELHQLMEDGLVPFSQEDCKTLIAIKDKAFLEAVSVMKSPEEVQATLKAKEITLSLDECNMLRLLTNKRIMKLLAKAKNTEEVQKILVENEITFSPETYSNLEWSLEVDVELSENELVTVTGGGLNLWSKIADGVGVALSAVGLSACGWACLASITCSMAAPIGVILFATAITGFALDMCGVKLWDGKSTS